MSERYVVRIIDNKGKIMGDYFVKYLSDERINGCINDAIENAQQKYLNVKNGNYDLCVSIIPFLFMNCLNGRLIEKGVCWAPTNLTGFYSVDFQQKKAYYYHINNKIWQSKEWKELDKLQDYSYGNKNSEEYKLYQEAHNNFKKMISNMLEPYIDGAYPQYDKCADSQELIYDFSNLYPQLPANPRIAKINRIAKKLIAGNTYDKMDEKTLKHFQNFFKNELGYRWKVYSHDGSSYDGFMSFTEGFVEAVTSYTGWDEMELFPNDFNKNLEYCMESFCSDYSELFEGKSKEQAMKILEQSISNQDYNNDEIWKKYEDYESDWMCEESGSLFVAIQFYANGESYNTQSWTCSIYAGKGDTYGRRQEYLYEDSIDFKDINEPGIINQIESKIRSAIEKSSFDSLD